MNDREKILAEIERLKTEIPYHENAWSVLDKIKVFINSLPAEKPSEESIKDLIQKAEELYGVKDTSFPLSEFPKEEKRQAFIKGAQWQKEQMMKSAIEVKINRDTLYNLKPIIHEKYQDLKIGDKILIIKEDEQ